MDSDRVLGAVRPFEWTELDAAPEPKDVARESSAEDTAEPEARPDPEALLSAAREEGAALLAGARCEAERLLAAARQEGLRAGLAEGRALAEEAAARWAGLAAELAAYKPTLYAEARAQVIELALALVHKMLGVLAEADDQIVVRVTGQALQALADREVLTIRVNPEDHQGLIEAKPKLLQSIDGVKKLTIVEDPSVERGGCLVETPTAEIDARLESQFQELARSIRKP